MVCRREDKYKLSLEVIVGCLWECCDSKFRGQEGQGDSQRGRVALPMALAGPSVTPALCQAWLDWP